MCHFTLFPRRPLGISTVADYVCDILDGQNRQKKARQDFQTIFPKVGSMPLFLQCKLITTRDELNQLQPEWNDLLQRSSSNNVFLTWEWISSWWDYFGGDRQPWVLSVRQSDNGKLIGVAPFAKEELVSRRGLRYGVLTFLGSGRPAPDHLDLIIDAKYNQIVASALMKKLLSLRGQWDILRLSGLAANSGLARYLLTRSGYRKVTEEVCPFVTVPVDWETYQMTLSKKMRFNIEYSGRRLEKLHTGNVSFHQVSSEEELENALNTLFRLHMEVREAHGAVGAFGDRRMREFHRCVASLFLKNGWLRLYRLRVGDKDIALLYCYHYNHVVSFYQSGYDQQWKEHSPGSQIIAYAIQQAIEEGATEFDFLRGAEPYKFRWTNQVRKDLNVEFSPGIVRRIHALFLDVDKLARTIRHKFMSKVPA